MPKTSPSPTSLNIQATITDMFIVSFTGFKSKEHAEAFANWYNLSGEQAADDWLDIQGQPSAYLTGPPKIEGNEIILDIKPKEDF